MSTPRLKFGRLRPECNDAAPAGKAHRLSWLVCEVIVQARLEIPSFRFGPSPLSLLFAKTDANKALVEQFNLLLPTAIKNKP